MVSDFYNDIIVAAYAYDDAAVVHHGEFAKLNFPARYSDFSAKGMTDE